MNVTVDSTNNENSLNDGGGPAPKSPKSELEILDKKIVKCGQEISAAKQKMQKEWSKQMSNHIKSFYADNDSENTNPASSSPNFAGKLESNEYEKRIYMLNKKLHSYEKRKQKLLNQDSEKNSLQDKNSDSLSNHSRTSGGAGSAGNNNNPAAQAPTAANQTLNNSNLSTSMTSSALQTLNNSNISSLLPGVAPPNQALSNATNTLNSTLQVNNPTKLAALRTHSGSFSISNPLAKSMNSEDFAALANQQTKSGQSGATAASNDDKASFYLDGGNQQTQAITRLSSNSTNNTNNPIAGAILNGALNEAEYMTDENNASNMNGNSATLVSNKSYPNFDRNLMLMQVEQEFYYLKLQHEKISSDLEELQKKMQDNHQLIIKELQHNSAQILEPVHKLSFNLYKTYDQKLEDLKSSLERSIQSVNYNLSHCHRDVKEIKEDSTYMKNRVEILEKSQNKPNVDTNPSSYYQLFYKLLDIILTLATIILLAITNVIASVKFIFLLYPRTIAIILFSYLFLNYLVDYEKLELYFHRYLLHDYDPTNLSKLPNTSNLRFYANDNHTNATMFTRILRSIYGLVFQWRSRSAAAPAADPAAST